MVLLLTTGFLLLWTARCEKRKIVVAVVDDLGWSDVGFQGDEPLRATPTLDALAASGVRFERMYGGCECTPSRAMLLTGKHAVSLGLQDSVVHGTEPRGMPLEPPTLGDKMRAFGYGTSCVGKWHLGFFAPQYLPRRRGFDYFFGILSGGGDHYAKVTTEIFEARASNDDVSSESNVVLLRGRNLWENDGPWEGWSDEHSTVLYTQKALDRLDDDGPTFVYLAYQAVHGPVQAGELPVACRDATSSSPDVNSALRPRLCGMVGMIDDSIKRIHEAMSRDEFDWTLWFVADNGGVRRHGSSNAPLRGEKGTVWDGGVRLVSFLAGSDVKPQRHVHLAHLVDIHATVAQEGSGDDLLGGRPVRFDGTPHRTRVLVNRNSDTWGGGGALVANVRGRAYKLVVENSVGDAVLYRAGRAMLAERAYDQAGLDAALDARRKLLFPEPVVHVFDLDADPEEANNLLENIDDDDDGASNLLIRDELLRAWSELDGKILSSPDVWRDDGPLADPALFGGTWRPWRDEDGLPLATYQIQIITTFNPA
ncbi:hypothetical protein CTAYLR_007299 [Chrysophaeum taylorii]|uniref:Sulfatase N-terminal domain-containing protein n=1 Tax=Chrysophaeum taylorii TaxID=2483200 RepID=A0AAD7UIC8_9STRA|nr:hypothetical protein CTAYLR_007299 [Chrysophaeum taylorii]